MQAVRARNRARPAVVAAMSECVPAFTASAEENLGHLEIKIAALAQQLVREALAQGAQRKAYATPPVCPQCRRPLARLSADHPRTVTARSGEITVRPMRGFCAEPDSCR